MVNYDTVNKNYDTNIQLYQASEANSISSHNTINSIQDLIYTELGTTFFNVAVENLKQEDSIHNS